MTQDEKCFMMKMVYFEVANYFTDQNLITYFHSKKILFSYTSFDNM